MSFLNDEQLKYLNGIGLRGTQSSKQNTNRNSELENLLRNDPIAADMYSYGAGGALPQGVNSETAGNGFFGWMKDSADAGAASVFGGTARTLGEFMPFGQEGFNSFADYMDEVARRNSPTEELTGMNYVASAIGNALGSGGATMAETAALIGAGKLLGLGGLASGALGVASKTPGLGTLVKAGKTMWQSPYGKYLVANVAGSPLEAVAESGNLITDMRNENSQAGYSKYSDDEIRSAALRSAGLNTAWLTAANMLEAGALGKITGALAGNIGERTAKQIARQSILGGGSSAISEGGEEYVQNLIGDYSKRGNLNDLNYDEALEAAKMGAIGGGVLGGIGAGGSAYFAKSAKPKGELSEEVTSEGETQNTEENFWDNKDNARKAIKDAYTNGMLSKEDARNLLIKLDNGEIGPEAEKVQKERAKQTEQLLEKQRLQGYDDELDEYANGQSVVEATAPSPAPEPVIQGLGNIIPEQVVAEQQAPRPFDNTIANIFAQQEQARVSEQQAPRPYDNTIANIFTQQKQLAEQRKALANILGNVATQKWDATQQEYGNRRQQAFQNLANIFNARAAQRWDQKEAENAEAERRKQAIQDIASLVNARAAGQWDSTERYQQSMAESRELQNIAQARAQQEAVNATADRLMVEQAINNAFDNGSIMPPDYYTNKAQQEKDAKERQKAAQAIANIVNARAAGMWDTNEAENQAKAEARQAIANIVNARAAQQWDNAEKGAQNEKAEQKREVAKNTQGAKAEEKQNAQADKNVKQPKEEEPKVENDNIVNLPEGVTEEKPVTNEQATKSEADNPNKVDSYQEEKKKLEVAIEKDMGKYPNTEFDKKKTGTLYKGKTWREVFKDISHNRDVYINVDYYVTDKILDEPRFKGYSLVAIDNKANYRNAIPRGFNDFIKDNFVPMNNNKNTLIYKGLADNQPVANNNEEDKSKPAEKTVNEIYKEGISKLQDTYGDFKANSKLDPTSVSREYTDNDGYTANILYNGTDDREAYNNTYNISVQPIGSNNLDVVFSDHVKLENIESKLAQLKEYLQKTRNNNMGNAAESSKVEDEATSAKQAKTEEVNKEPKFKWNKGTSQSDPVRFGTITLPDGTKQNVSVRPNINGDVEGEYNTVTVSDSKNNIVYINTNVDDVNVNKEIDNFIKNAGNRKSVTEEKYQKDYDLAGPIKVIPQNGGTLAASSFNGLMGNVVISMADGTKAFTNTHTLCLNFDEKKYSKLISKDTKLSALHSSSVDQIVRDTEDKVSKKKLIPHNLIPIIMPLGDVNITILRNNESVITVVADYVKYFVKEYGNNIKFYGNGQNNTILITDANGKTLGVITPIRVKADLYGTLNKFIDDGCPYISKYGERYVDPEIAAENARIEKEIAEQDAKKPKMKVSELKSLVDKCLANLEDGEAEDDVLVYLEEHLSFKEYTSFSENGVIKEDAVNRINPAELKEINNILEKFNRRDDPKNPITNDVQEPIANKANSQNKPQNEQSEEYKYYMNERGASIGAVPDGFTRIDENDKGGRYGAIYYAKPLSKSEVAAYELTPDKNNKKQESIQDFGAYVAGARKDYSSENTGGKAKTSSKKDDKKDVPEWQKPFSVVTDPIMGMSDKPYHISYNPRQGSKIPIIYRRLSAEGFATEQEAMNAIKAAVFMHNFSIPQRKLSDGSIEYSIEKKIGDHKWWPIKDGFKSREEVDQYVKQHIDEILATKTYYGEGDLATPLIKDWREARQGKAKDRLKGKNVTTEMFMNEFGFRGVQFGNWNNQQERQELMNATYEAMHDLADLLGVPPKIVSLNGELALAFGARGVGLSGARAHFEPTATIINLTKMKGAGALAHEWQHAVDQYLLIKGGIIKNERDGGGWLTSKNAMAKASELGYDFRRTDNLTPALKDSFIKLMDVIMYKEETFTKDTNLIDKRITNNKEALDDKLNKLRQYIANERKYGSKKAAATPKQLAKFDEAAQKVAQFEGKLEWDWKLQRYTCPELEALGAVVKEVTNRGFAKNNDTASNLSYYLSMLHKLRKEKADAGVNSVGIKRVPTDYKAANIHIDNGRATDYWSKPTEMLSRAFSSYLEDKLKKQGYSSDFLSYGSYNYMYLFGKPFPEGKERERINKAFDEFYKEVAKEVERNIKETGEIKFSIKADNNAYKVDAADNNARTYSEVLEETIDAFPNAKITYNDNGQIVAELPNGAKFAISIKDNIILNESQQKKANASHGTINGVVQGLWKKLNSSGVGRLLEVSQQSQQGTAYHEALHAAMDLALNKKEKTALLKYYAEKAKQENRNTEETLADAYRDWKLARQQNKGTRFGKLWQKVKDLCTRLKSLFDEGAKVESIFLDIESGKVYERATEELNLFNLGQEDENTQYSVAQTAYHGTNRIFNKFTMDHLRQGSGGLTHGYGLYFAKDEKVANAYRSETAGDSAGMEFTIEGIRYRYDREAETFIGTNDKEISVNGNSAENLLANALYMTEDKADAIDYLKENSDGSAAYRRAIALAENGNIKITKAGATYEALIPGNDELLDEDKTFSQQPKAVQQGLQKAFAEVGASQEFNTIKAQDSYGADIYTKLMQAIMGDNADIDDNMDFIENNIDAARQASELLNKNGIKGLHYWEKGDKDAFVVFSDEAIKIQRQYMAGNISADTLRPRAEIEAEIRTAFPNGTITYENGVPVVTLPNGAKFQYSIRKNIIVNAREQKKADSAHGTSGGAIQGFWQKFSGNGVQRLLAVAQNSERGTAFHEAMHAAIDLALTEKEANALRKYYQNKAKEQNRNVDEVIADAYRDWVLARQQKRGTVFGKLWQKIKDFCVRIRALFDNGAEVKRIMQDVESGKVYERGTYNSNIKKRIYFSKVEIQGQAGSGTTQIAGTRGMYVKALKWLRGKHQDAKTVLDYGAGLGLGTDDMRQNNPDLNIDSYEPNPERWQGKKPPSYTNNTQINKDYDLILNTNVLNVVEKPIRDLIVKDIASHLNMNGKALITTRGWKGDISTAKNFKPSDEYHGIWIDKGKNGLVFQKGFDGDELKNYIEELLGNDFVVEKTRPTFGKSSVTITRIKPKADTNNTQNAKASQGMPDSYKTLKGSAIKRSKYGVGKLIGGQIYLHKDYALDVIPKDVWEKALKVLADTNSDFKYNCVMYDAKTGNVRFDEAPDFDTAREPVVGNTLTVKPDGTTKAGYSKYIWHHKWIWVKNDYQGFDVNESKAWSQKWLGILTETADGNGIERWNAQLDRFGLEHDGENIQYSVAAPKSKIASAFTNTERKGTIQSVKDFFKEHWKSFYSDYVDKNDVLHAFDVLTNSGLTLYEQVQNLPSTTAGFLKAIMEGTAAHIDAANKHLKNVKMKYRVTLAMALDTINKETMDKAHPDYLAQNGFDSWVNALGAYLGAERLLEMNAIAKAQGEEYKLPKGLTEAELQQFVRNAPMQFKKAADIFYKVNDNMLSVMEDAGVFSHDLAQLLRTKYKKYCPLLRDFSDTAAADNFINGLTTGGRGIGNVSIPLKKISISGSERGVLNPLETVLKSYAVMLNRAERNKVGLMAVNSAKEAGMEDIIEEVPEIIGKNGEVVNAVADPKNCVFTVLVNGKKKAYKTTPELYGPIVGYNMPAAGLVFGVARTAAKMLRTGATMSPSFILRNVLRDTFFAGISSKNGFIPILDTLRGMNALWNDPAMRAEFEAAGVTEFNFYSSQEQRIKSIDAMAGEKSVGPLEMIKWAFRKLESFSDFMESATRMGEFMKARGKGLSIEEAARAAREVTLDFSRSGRVGEQINQVVPFFNACVQGGDKMRRLFKEDFRGTCVKLFKYIVLPSLALWLWNHDEDWYKDLDPDIKNNYWCVGKVWRIPKPQEVGVIFGSGIEALLDQSNAKDPEAIKNLGKVVFSNLMPGIVPTLILPLLEWQANYSSFKGRPLVSNKYQRLPDELQYNDYTSELSKSIGNNPLYKVSPMKVDNLVRGYTGTMGALLWSLPDYATDKAKNQPARNWYEYTPFRDFTVTDANMSRPLNDFYGMLDAANRQHSGYGVKGKPTQAVQTIRKTGMMISNIRKDIDKITKSKLTAERKRQLIDQRKAKMNQLARQANERYGKYFD